ncbi:MAG: M12 family metallo-peptidase, partial [Candidatus Rokubacteria bacterium]|nr:M12 family metallo-peptidase [Candidatus Rokubacteria bacterium]
MLHLTPLLRRSAAVLSILAAAAAAQAPTAPSVLPAPPGVLQELGLSSATLQSPELPEQPGSAFAFPLWLDGAWREVSAWPHSVRAPGYRLMVEDGSGAAFEHPPTPETTYRGAVAGFPGSLVALSLYEGTVQGIVRLGAEEPWHGFQPLPGAAAGEHVVYSERDVLPLDVQCGGALDVLRGDDPGGAGAPAPDGSSTKICEIAIDADFEFFQSNGSSVTATQNDITNVINAVDAIYEAEVGIIYDITVIYVETAEPDPYSSTSAGTLLDQFQNHWNSQHQADPRDVAHLF